MLKHAIPTMVKTPEKEQRHRTERAEQRGRNAHGGCSHSCCGRTTPRTLPWQDGGFHTVLDGKTENYGTTVWFLIQKNR